MSGILKEEERTNIFSFFSLSTFLSLSHIKLFFFKPGTDDYTTQFKLYVCAQSLQSCPTLCDPMDHGPPGSSSMGFSRQEYWGGLPFPSPVIKCEVSEVSEMSEVAQSCPSLSDPMDYILPGSSVHGVFQARVLERVAISFLNSVPRII